MADFSFGLSIRGWEPGNLPFYGCRDGLVGFTWGKKGDLRKTTTGFGVKTVSRVSGLKTKSLEKQQKKGRLQPWKTYGPVPPKEKNNFETQESYEP